MINLLLQHEANQFSENRKIVIAKLRLWQTKDGIEFADLQNWKGQQR